MSTEYYLDQVKKCVTFFFVEQGGKMHPIGTGFFVGIKLEKDVHAVYLVTAKHVLQSNTGQVLSKVLIRLNTKKDTSSILK